VKRLSIIGGGITGLSAAWSASRSGAKDLEITIIEREDRFGGKIRTDSIEGYLLEQGPDSFLTSRPEALRLCEDLEIDTRLVPRIPRSVSTFVSHRHVLSPLPDGYSTSLPMDAAALAVSPLLSEDGGRRAREESAESDESVASLMIRRFGSEAFDLFVEPLVGGIHAGDTAVLCAQATLPRRAAGQHEGARSQFLAFPGGTEELIQALERKLAGVRILRAAGADAIRPHGRGYGIELSDGRVHEADALILAIPAHEAARIVLPLDAELPELIRLIPSASTVVIHLAWQRSEVPHALDGYGYLIPSVERSDLVACTWSSQKWAGRAPDGMVLMRLFAGRFGRRDLLGTPDEELFALARAEVEATLGVRAAPRLQMLHRWNMGMPQYTVGHLGRVQDIRARAAGVRGLFLAGAAFDGVGVPQCVGSGASAAASAIAFLEEKR
jgi:oxygen-dependent protoporphyrinogen oxidase